jgi:DNA-binding PadR family transcriptional regulator
VLVASPRYRRPLNSNQDHLLKLLFKFRFISVPVLAELVGKDKSTIYESLYVLEKQGYIAKRYTKEYRLQLRPAEYYLANTGIRYLRDTTDISDISLRNLYKNKSADETLINNCLEATAIYLKLRDAYPDTFDIFTKTEASQIDWMPRPLPSLYLRRTVAEEPEDGKQLEIEAEPEESDTRTNYHYIVHIVEASLPRYILSKILRFYQNHSEEDWDEDELGSYPDLLLLSTNERTEQRLLPLIENMLQDFEIYTATIERLYAAKDNKIWAYAFDQEEDEPLVLREL